MCERVYMYIMLKMEHSWCGTNNKISWKVEKTELCFCAQEKNKWECCWRHFNLQHSCRLGKNSNEKEISIEKNRRNNRVKMENKTKEWVNCVCSYSYRFILRYTLSFIIVISVFSKSEFNFISVARQHTKKKKKSIWPKCAIPLPQCIDEVVSGWNEKEKFVGERK